MANIAWLVPRLIKGSGGHRTILQHAHYLEQKGHSCSIYLEGPGSDKSAIEEIKNLFGYEFNSAQYGWEKLTSADVAVATVWYSAKFVRDLPFDCLKLYFVQDYEAMFMPMGYGYIMAENSYKYGLTPITIGHWLEYKLKAQFNVPAYSYEFGAKDCEIQGAQSREPKSVCFIYQPEKPRRCAELGIEALGIVKHYMPEVKIYLYGSKKSEQQHLWFEAENLGLLSPDECTRLYSKCSLGLCLSSSNPSRVPFEMMKAGLPVVELYRENNLYDMPPEAVLLCDQTPESLASGVMTLLSNDQRRLQMSTFAREFMRDRSLECESEQFAVIVEGLISGNKIEQKEKGLLYTIPAHTSQVYTGRCHPSGGVQHKRRVDSLPRPVYNMLRRLYRYFMN